MKKRGARIRHRASSVPGLLAQTARPEYELRLRGAEHAFRLGCALPSHFDDLADACDLMRIGEAAFGKRDACVPVVCDQAAEALANISGRWKQGGKLETIDDEPDALVLLVEVSLDFWNRRSGALYAEAYRQLVRIRKMQREQSA